MHQIASKTICIIELAAAKPPPTGSAIPLNDEFGAPSRRQIHRWENVGRGIAHRTFFHKRKRKSEDAHKVENEDPTGPNGNKLGRQQDLWI